MDEVPDQDQDLDETELDEEIAEDLEDLEDLEPEQSESTLPSPVIDVASNEALPLSPSPVASDDVEPVDQVERKLSSELPFESANPVELEFSPSIITSAEPVELISRSTDASAETAEPPSTSNPAEPLEQLPPST
ncbi:hypothetical protein BVRB_025680, partial [Beta vulgaris subsp. vulgaris]